jgi:Haem-dependent oxidative N-demethylase, alpha subunit-like
MALPYFPIDDGDYQITMGLKPLKDQSWLEVDSHYADEINLKKHLLQTERDAVFASLPGANSATAEIRDLVITEMTTRFPNTTLPPDFADTDPLYQAATMVQEDLLLMQPVDGDFKLTAAAVCFPSGWNLVDKVGKELSEIHLPVPGLNDRIGKSINLFFRNIKPGKNVYRFNWGLFDDDALFQPDWWRDQQPAKPSVTPETIGKQLFLRVEKQTLQQLSKNEVFCFQCGYSIHP